MGREASAEPGRPPAYGRRGPCRWRSKGQRAETARELTLGSEVPSPAARASTGTCKSLVCARDPGPPNEGPEQRGAGSQTSETPGLVPGAKPRGSASPRAMQPSCRRENPPFGARARRWRFLQKLEWQEALRLFSCLGGGGSRGCQERSGKGTAGGEEGGGARRS